MEVKSRLLITWRYVDTIQNLANIASRGSKVENLRKEWYESPRLLVYPEQWPQQNEIKPTESIMCIPTDKSEEINQLLEKLEFWKVIGITSWIFRLVVNCQSKEKLAGSVKTNETEITKVSWIKHEQGKIETTDNFKKIKVK